MVELAERFGVLVREASVHLACTTFGRTGAGHRGDSSLHRRCRSLSAIAPVGSLDGTPARRDRPTPRRISRAARAEAAGGGGWPQWCCGSNRSDDALDQAARAAGLTQWRDLLQMRCALPAAATDAAHAGVHRRRHRRVPRREQPGVRLAPRTGQHDRRRPRRTSAPSRGSTADGFLASTSDGRLAGVLLDQDPPGRRGAGRSAARRDLRHRGRPRRSTGRASAKRSPLPGSQWLRGPRAAYRHALRRARQRRRGADLRAHRLHGASRRPRLRSRRDTRDRRPATQLALRHRPATRSPSCCTASRAIALDQVWHGLYEHACRTRCHRPPCPKACAPDSTTELPLALDARRPSRSSNDGDNGQVAVAAPRRRAHRDRAHALPRPVHGVRQHAGRLRDGVRLLRDRPRPASNATSPSARSSSR